MEFVNDVNILLSLVNTYLRDGGSLEDFCAERGVSEEELISSLSAHGFYYDADGNTFKGI